MEIFRIKIDKVAQKDIDKILKSGNKSDISRLEKIIAELSVDPKNGIGNPERLKYYNNEVWSRQLNKKDRIIYQIIEEEVIVIIISALGHYSDK